MMPIDSSLLPPAGRPDDLPSGRPDAASEPRPGQATPPLFTPNIAHTALFLLLVLVAALLVGLSFGVLLQHIAPHLHEPLKQMQTDPRLVVPVEAVLYGLAAGAGYLIFPMLWGRSFGEGIHWCWSAVKRHWWATMAIGVVTSVVVQALSNFLPIPKELPIDKFFTNQTGVWLIAIFGVTVAPAFEELAFRGFLLPSLATAWDWVAVWMRRRREADQGERPDDREPWPAPPASLQQPRWSVSAMVFSTIVTSIGFAMLHGAQLAHSFAPLAVLFCVSVVLCVTRIRFHSLAASTLVHSMYNATIFVLLFVGTGGFRHLDKLG